MKKYFACVAGALFCAVSWAQAGTKEEIIRLQSDVLQLRNQMRLLQKSIEDENSFLKSLLEQLNDQVAKSNLTLETIAEGIQAQVADETTAVAQLRRDIQTLSVKWDDTNNRIATVHEKLQENQLKVSTLREIPVAGQGGVIAPDQVYTAAYNDYLMGNYDLAIDGFQHFLATYRDSELSDNALYYMGVASQNQRQYERAIQAFDQVINLYPKADKTPIAYYKKARVLQDLQRPLEAIETLKKLLTVFPDSQEAGLAREELQELGIDRGLKTESHPR